MSKRGAYSVIYLFALLCSCVINLPAQILVKPDQTAQALAQYLAGAGVTISNCTLNCPAQANGFFHVVSSVVALDSGILLTNGRAGTSGISYGVNGYSSNLASNDNGVPGDTMLDPLAGEHTLDACSLEFDVVPVGDTIRFNYVFSSEEYKNAVCGPYNDAFAFFISGPGIAVADNMALIPGTNIPVTINTINNGVPGSTGTLSNCTSMGTGSPFTQYYIDNSAGTTLTHQGLTTVLLAIHAVTPCSSYHLKIVIADAGDPLYDSGVFLEAGSLQTNIFSVNALVPPVPVTTGAFCIKGCLPGIFQVKRTITGTQPQTIKYFTGGNAVSGYDYSPLSDSVVIPANSSMSQVELDGLPTPVNGTKTLKVYILSPYSCNGINSIADSASILIYDTLSISMSTPDTIICGNINLPVIVNGPDFLTYSWSPSQGLNFTNIQDPVAAPSSNTDYTVTASLPGTACPDKTASLNMTIKLTPVILLSSDTTVCFNAGIQLNASLTEPDQYYSYQWTGPENFVSSLQTSLIQNAAAQSAGPYNLTVTIDTNGCKDNASIQVNVTVPDTPQFASPQIFCLNTPPEKILAKGDSLQWYSPADSVAQSAAPMPPTDQIASYVYYVSQVSHGCESPKGEVLVDILKCCDGEIFIPSAFTPNGDGKNDQFEVLEDYGYSIASMQIFNRWGQVVYNGSGKCSWDGKYMGAFAEMGTYFYAIKFACILGGTFERKGDLTLIR